MDGHLIHPYSRLPISKAAAAFVLFCANGTNIVANWVRKSHKVKEDSSNIFKIANIGKLKVAKIGKMWYKQTAAKSGINFTLSFNGNY